MSAAATAGPGRGRSRFVLVPGWGMGPGCWNGFGAALERDGVVHHAALPGHAGAADSPGWTPEALADRECRAWPDAWWVGWSLGALVALAAARRHPDRVRGLILVGATPRFVADADWPCAMAPATFDAFRDGCRDDPVGTLRRFQGLVVQGDEAARSTLRSLRRQAAAEPAPSAEGLLEGLRVLATSDCRESLGEVHCPVLWITGSADALAPPEAARRAARKLREARVCYVPGAGHAPFLSHEAALLRAVRQAIPDSLP